MGKVLFVACTNVARYMVEEIKNNPAIQDTEIVGIVNLDAKQAMNKANYDSYADLALQYDIPLHYCNNVNDQVTLDWMREKQPDIIIQSGWSQKFKEELLNLPTYGCIGEHPAPLPRGRGAACVNWAILTGERDWGDTFFQMIDQYDKGVIYAQATFQIDSYDSVYTVYEKVALASQSVVAKNIDRWVQGDFDVIAQDDAAATYYGKRRPTDGEFTFAQDAAVLHDFIRAQTKPYPGAYFLCDGEKITVLATALSSACALGQQPGTCLARTDDGGVLVACANGTTIKLLRVQEQAKPSKWACDWLQGRTML